ncbi:MAG: cation diffusion facilitator family transporter [Chitinivibrionales bacterium]|nr:cation diffusion facilitator family transporter [Chitinivibrionales bacterium]MBD3359021.1 cation diffusion facilitator family transporter [Chitinivibrionales bacterium]
MAHDHSHDHSHTHAHTHATGSIGTAFFLNLLFTVAEFFGGVLTNSVAILSDAVHDLGDSITLGLSWYLNQKSIQGRDERFSYGYRRFSLLGALATGIVLLGGSILVLSEAIPRLLEPETPNAPGMLAFSIVGIVVNGAAVLRLRGLSSLNARVVALHLLEDVLGWVGVLIVSVTLLFLDLPILDPILSIVITSYILYNVARNLRKTLTVFLQAVPSDADPVAAEALLSEIEGVISVHHTHSWSLDGEHHVLTTHVVVSPQTSWEEASHIKRKAKKLLRSHDFHFATIEIEVEGEPCEAED